MNLVDTEAIRDAVAFCVGEGITIYWDGEAETPMATVPYVVAPAGACRVRLSLSTAVQIGEDDVRMVHNLSSDMLETTYSGNRMATLSLRIEADAREEAYETAERVRTRLRFRTPHELLKAANISIARIENNQGIDYSWDNRDISACVLDIRLNIGSNDRDEDITYIETVNTDNVVPGAISGLVPPPVFTLISASPALVDVAGGVPVVLSGTGFELAVTARIDGVDYPVSFVNSNTVVLTAPAHAIGIVSITVGLGNNRSNPIDLEYAQTFNPVQFMAERNMAIYLVGSDWSAAQPTRWPGRASAGTSANKQFRRDRYPTQTGYQPNSKDPSAETVNGRQWVKTHADGSPMILRNLADTASIVWFDSAGYGPGDWTVTAAVRYDVLNRTSGTNGGGISMPPNANGTFYPGAAPNGSMYLAQRSQASTDTIQSPPGIVAAGEVCVIQCQYQESTGILRFRKNKGPWYNYSGIATDRSPAGDYLAIMNCLGSLQPFQGALGVFAAEQSFVAESTANTIVDACAMIAGIAI